jgi:uncharacterized membrane protein
MTGEPESLAATEPLAVGRARHNFERLIMLSDGVFAIAMTLLALDVRVPAGSEAHLASLWVALKPVLSAYALSFLVISAYWLLHRRSMAVILRVDAIAAVLNLLVLGLVSLLPAGTRLASSGQAMSPGLGLYAGLVIAIGAAMACFWGYAALIGRLVSAEVGRRERWVTFLGVLLSAPLFLLLTIGGHVPPGVVPAVLLVLFVVGWLILQRLSREPPAKPRPVPDAGAAKP